MSSLTVNTTNQSNFQQFSSSLAQTNAAQVAQQAQTLRQQADAAQALAEQYNEKAQSLNNQANKEQVKSDSLSANLNLANAFVQTADQTSNLINHAVVRPLTYTSQGTSSTTGGSNAQTSGTRIDTVA